MNGGFDEEELGTVDAINAEVEAAMNEMGMRGWMVLVGGERPGVGVARSTLRDEVTADDDNPAEPPDTQEEEDDDEEADGTEDAHLELIETALVQLLLPHALYIVHRALRIAHVLKLESRSALVHRISTGSSGEVLAQLLVTQAAHLFRPRALPVRPAAVEGVYIILAEAQGKDGRRRRSHAGARYYKAVGQADWRLKRRIIQHYAVNLGYDNVFGYLAVPLYGSVLRCYIPLLRAPENVDNPLHDLAAQFLGERLPYPAVFVSTLAKEYVRRQQQELLPEIVREMPIAIMWALQLAREQLAMLEVLFWLAGNLVPASGPVVVQLVKTPYETDLGRKLLLEDEGAQILQDAESVWLVLLVEAFDVEKVLEDDTFELVAFPQDVSTILSSSRQLALVHDFVVGAHDPRYSPITLAWACVLVLECPLDTLRAPPSIQGSSNAGSSPSRSESPYGGDIDDTQTHNADADDPTAVFARIKLQESLQRNNNSDSALATRQVAHHENTRRCALTDNAERSSSRSPFVPRSLGVVTRQAAHDASTGYLASSPALSSALKEPNAIAFQAIVKGLLIVLCERCAVQSLSQTLTRSFDGSHPTSRTYCDGSPYSSRRSCAWSPAMARSRDGALYAHRFLNDLPAFNPCRYPRRWKPFSLDLSRVSLVRRSVRLSRCSSQTSRKLEHIDEVLANLKRSRKYPSRKPLIYVGGYRFVKGVVLLLYEPLL
ncbi:hypothetical protein EXIGLDRAFT_779335 [Exidia glandulosa HHB12029]|uniref:Uncharacterized protein n=1 Tax=Exidia glandulosa HHB12029 TaxID=1314781 RepID=A0A165C464_EXIGL|nr:hypothetical protein EXIGLDRAFT_779335 [Exidia glandulosa HHB12029]